MTLTLQTAPLTTGLSGIFRPNNKIGENTVPGVVGMNGARQMEYMGPCPPSGTHRYFFKVYALDTELKLGVGSKKKDVEKAMQGHILAKGELMGLYSKT